MKRRFIKGQIVTNPKNNLIRIVQRYHGVSVVYKDEQGSIGVVKESNLVAWMNQKPY